MLNEILEEICNRLAEELGQGWEVKSYNTFNCVYYFICSKDDLNFLTHSYGIYAQTDIDKIIKTEKPLILSLYEKKAVKA